MIGSFGGFGGMGLGALSGLGGFAPTPAQIQERLKASGITNVAPPAPVVAPRPAPVVAPRPAPVVAPRPAPVAPPPVVAPRPAPAPAPVAPAPVAPAPVAPRPVSNVMSATPGQISLPANFSIPNISDLQNNPYLKKKREEQAAKDAKLARLKAEVDARNRAGAKANEEKAAKLPGANISAYYDALRAGEDPSKFADVLQKSLAEQDYVSTGMEMAEAGAYGPVEDKYIVPGGLTTEGLGEFKFDKTLKDFEGYDFDYGKISDKNLKKFQEELMPVMAPAVAQAQLEGKSYQNALIQAYERSPEVQEIYAKYDIAPQRISRKYGSEYLYDPFTFSEIQTVDRSPGTSDYVKAVGLAIGTAALGGALVAPGASPLSAAATKGLTSAGVTAATGGDPSDILKSGLLGGVGGYAEGLSNTAKAAETAAKGAKAGSELAKAAELARKTSDTFNTVVKTGKFVDAAIDGNLGSIAIAAFGDDFTKAALDKIDPDDKFFSGLNINKSDLTKGLVKTQMELAKGTDFEDALLRGVGEYIMEGGALGPNNIKTPEFIKAIGDVLQDAGRMIDDTFLQPIKEIAEPVIDVAKDVGKAVDKKVFQPAKEVVQEVTEPVTKPLVKGAKAVGETVGDVAGVVGDVIEALPNPNLPVDLPRKVGTPPFFPVTPTSTPTPTPTYAYTPGIIEERGAELFDLGEKQERKVDSVEAYLASLAAGGMANGGAVRSSYGNLDELLRIVEGE